MKSFLQYISESKDGHIYVVHGGSDFDNIDLKHSGRGEPGNIRPLGPGLYGYHVPTNDDEEAHNAISWAQNYGKKYGRGNKTLHVFKVPRTTTLGMNTPTHHIGQFASSTTPDEHAWLNALGDADKLPRGPERSAAYEKARAMEPKIKGTPQMRAARLPIGTTEVSILDPTVVTRVGKFPIDTPPHEILNHIKKQKD